MNLPCGCTTSYIKGHFLLLCLYMRWYPLFDRLHTLNISSGKDT